LPVIFEVEHLSLLVGIKIDELFKMICSPVSFYRVFNIPKRRGGYREISSPYPSLLSCQAWIYKNILLCRDIHDCAHGFVPGRSVVTNARCHLNKKALLKMDLKDFFPSIPMSWVVNFFSDLGYSKSISFYLASLSCLNGSLAQGSATSPYLSNILLVSLDSRLNKLARAYNLSYTRYADDLAFSGDYIPHKFISIVEGVVVDYGLSPNKNKTSLLLNSGQRIVTGVSVSGGRLTLPRSTRRDIRKEFHYIKKYGVLSHISKEKIRNPFYLDVIEGRLSFWLQVEPDSTFALDAIGYIRSVRLEAG
jgi:RNA-directed DNA polymerase